MKLDLAHYLLNEKQHTQKAKFPMIIKQQLDSVRYQSIRSQFLCKGIRLKISWRA